VKPNLIDSGQGNITPARLFTPHFPGGGTGIYQFPSSDSSGQTQLTLPPIRAQNGTLIPYKVCLEGFGAAEVCTSESFMIWGN